MQVICYSKNSYCKILYTGNWNGAADIYEHSQTTSVELEGKKKASNMEEILNRKRAKQMK